MPLALHNIRACVASFIVAWQLAGIPAAEAAPVVYFGLDNADLSGGGAHPNADAAALAFAGASGPLAVQGFEGFALGTVPASFAVGGTNATFASHATDYSQISTGVGTFSTYAGSGSRYLESLSDNGSTYFEINFDQPLRALGFTLTDPSDWFGTTGPIPGLTLNLFQGGGTIAIDLLDGLDASTLVNGSFAFFGVVDATTPITGFSISSLATLPAGDAIGLDDLRISLASSSSVPEPGALGLVAIALLGAAAVRRRVVSGG